MKNAAGTIPLPSSCPKFSAFPLGFHGRHVEVDSLDSNSRYSQVRSGNAETNMQSVTPSNVRDLGFCLRRLYCGCGKHQDPSLRLGATNRLTPILWFEIISDARPGCRAHTHSAAQTFASPRRAASAGTQFASWPLLGWKERFLEFQPLRRPPSPQK